MVQVISFINITHVKKYCKPITDDNVCDPNDVNVKSPESEKSESVPNISTS